MTFEEVHEVHQLVVVQTVVAEVQDALHRALLRVLDDPLEVLQLQVCDADMTHDALLLQFHECRQCLVHHLLQSALHRSLKLDVVYIDEVDIVDVEALHALVHTLCGTFAGVVPRVHAILAIAPHFRTQKILVSWNPQQSLAQHRLSLVVAVVRTHVNKVDTALDGCFHSLDALSLLRGMKHAAQR